MKTKHYLRTVIADVDKTHPKLGRGVVMAMLTIKSRKMLLVVSPRGCGKSRVSAYVGRQAKSSMILDRLSVAGLSHAADQFSNFKGVVVVDDIAKTQTPYARISTITTLAELIYSHYCMSHLSKMDFEIKDFYGSAIVNVQPVLLRALVTSPEWEASIQDKTIRYYHLHRPLNPNPSDIKLELEWGLDFKEWDGKEPSGRLWEVLQKLVGPQWGLARRKEHLRDLLKAAAALDNREQPNTADYLLLIEVLRPLMIERLVMDKADFESKRFLFSNKLAIMTEFLTYGQFTLSQLAEDYKVSEATAYRLMDEQHKDWRVIAKSPTTYGPSPELMNELRRLNLL